MGDRRALDRFTIELYKTAKEMSIENSKKCGYFFMFLTYSFLLSLQKSIANRHAAWYNRLKEVRGGDFVVNMKTIGSAVVIILAAIVGLLLGAAMNDGLSGSILLAVIAGFVCVIYTIENSGKK